MSENKSRAVQHIVGYRMNAIQRKIASGHEPSAMERQRNVRMTREGRQLWIRVLQESQTASLAVADAWEGILEHPALQFARAGLGVDQHSRLFPWREPFDSGGLPLITGCEAVALLLRLVASERVDTSSDAPVDTSSDRPVARPLTKKGKRTRKLVDPALRSLMKRLKDYKAEKRAVYRGDPYVPESASRENSSRSGNTGCFCDKKPIESTTTSIRPNDVEEDDLQQWRQSNLVETAAALLDACALAISSFDISLPQPDGGEGDAPLQNLVWEALTDAVEWLRKHRLCPTNLWPEIVPLAGQAEVAAPSIYTSSRVVLAMVTARNAVRERSSESSLPSIRETPDNLKTVELRLEELIEQALLGLFGQVFMIPVPDDDNRGLLAFTKWRAQFRSADDKHPVSPDGAHREAKNLFGLLQSPADEGALGKALHLAPGAHIEEGPVTSNLYYFDVPPPKETEHMDHAETLLRALVTGSGGELIPLHGDVSKDSVVGWADRGLGMDGTASREVGATAAAVRMISEALLAELANLPKAGHRPKTTHPWCTAERLKLLTCAARYLVAQVARKNNSELDKLLGMQTREASASPVATLRYDCLPYDVLGAIGAYRRLASCDLAKILADAPAPGRWFDFSDDEEKAYLNGVKWMLTPYGGDLEEPTAGGLRNKRAGGFLICGAEPGMRSRPLSGIRSTERALSALRYLEVPEEVAQVGQLLDDALQQARLTIVTSFKEAYDPLENKHQIRVAWGLIEAESAAAATKGPSGES